MNQRDEDDLEARMRKLDAGGRRALLDDLESIRTLLDERAPEQEAAAEADAIPVLREVVRQAERPAQGSGDSEEPAPDKPIEESQGDLFDPRAFADRLLDDQWAEERERILTDARRGAEAFSLGLDPAEIARRQQHFREQVQAQLAPRMEQLMGEAIDELQTNMMRVVRRELESLIAECFGAQDTTPAADANRRPDQRDD